MGTVRQGGTVARGYGVAHQKLRRKWAAVIARGDGVCARCDRWIPPDDAGARCPKCGAHHRTWHLGHVDGDRTRYSGPEHECCNCGTNERGRLTSRAPRPVLRANWW